MLYFNLLSSDIIKEGTDSKYMSFSKLNSNLDSNFLKIYTLHVSIVLLLLMYSCCYGYGYLCLVEKHWKLGCDKFEQNWYAYSIYFSQKNYRY